MAELENKISTENVEATEATEQVESIKTYSQAEVDELLQREADRRVTAALKKAEEKNAEKIKEAQKIAEMDAQQKYEYELKQREAAIAAKEKALLLAENKNSAAQALSEKGLSLDLVNFVVSEDSEEMNDRIKKLEFAFRNSVKTEVEKRISSTTPKQVVIEPSFTKKLSDYTTDELQELKMKHPELFEKLKN